MKDRDLRLTIQGARYAKTTQADVLTVLILGIRAVSAEVAHACSMR